MKRKLLLILGLVFVMTASLACVAGCDSATKPEHEHEYAAAWVSDGESHWHECSCGEKADVEAHKGGTATCTAKAVCEVCNEAYGELDLTNHASDEFEYVSKDNGKHDKVYKCCKAAATENEDCSGGTATCTEKAVCEFCKAEYGDTLAHDFKTEWSSDDANHWHECSVCGEKADVEAHKGGAATCTAKAVCEVCETEYGDTLGHDFKTEWSSDGDNHWHECSRCSEKTDIAAHAVNEWVTTDGGRTGKCVCGKELIVAVENVATDKITLYTVETLADTSYAHSVAYAPSVTVNGEAIEVTVTVSGDEAVYTADKKLEAVAAGTVRVTVKYTIAGEEITKSFEVEIIKPVITVDTAVNYFSAIDGKDSSVDLFEYFNGVTFTAKQTYGGQEITLTVDAENKALLGAVTESKKATVCSITLDSDNYGVVYNKVTAYTKVITDYTDFEDMRLTADRKTIEGYFIMNADVNLTGLDIDGDGTKDSYDTFYPYWDKKASTHASKDMLTDVKEQNCGFGFVGTFDGNGHKITGFLAGSSYGFFGTISGTKNNYTVVKNVAFINTRLFWTNWTKSNILANSAIFVTFDNVYLQVVMTDLADSADYNKNFNVFGSADSPYVELKNTIFEFGKTLSTDTFASSSGSAVGIFASAAMTNYYSDKPTYAGYMFGSSVKDFYIIAAAAANGRVMPLVQHGNYTLTDGKWVLSGSMSVYASNDFVDMGEKSLVELEAKTRNPIAAESGANYIYHWANAYRYDNYEQMKEATTKVGNWDISSGAPVWVA